MAHTLVSITIVSLFATGCGRWYSVRMRNLRRVLCCVRQLSLGMILQSGSFWDQYDAVPKSLLSIVFPLAKLITYVSLLLK